VDTLSFPITAGQLAQVFGAKLIGDAGTSVESLAPLSAAAPGTLSFCASTQYDVELSRVRGCVLFISEELVREGLPVTFLVVKDPKQAFAKVAKGFHTLEGPKTISPLADIHPTARLGTGVSVGAFASIGAGTSVGKGTVIFPRATLGMGVDIGENCEIHPNAVIWDRVRVGNRVKIFAGAVIGSDGFGYLDQDSGPAEMPQVGTVVIESDVRVGALCTIDRATLGETRIGEGTKLDDHVHVGHNCQVGKRVRLCAQVGLGGSAIIEDDVILAGQVGIGHGVTIGKKARMGGQAGTSTNLKGDETYLLTPAVPIREVVKMIRHTRRLPEIWDRLKALEKQLTKGPNLE